MSHPVNWFNIAGSNGAALQSFYKKVFGWKMQSMPGADGGMQMVEAEKGGIPGGVGPTMDGSNKSVAVYVEVANIDAHLKTIAKAGGKMSMPKSELPAGMGFIADFEDPAGNWIGLWQPAAAPASATTKKASRGSAKPKPKAKAKVAKRSARPKPAAKKANAKAAKTGKAAASAKGKKASKGKPAAKGKKA